MTPQSPRTPILLFGAFDRHNLGDLLFPHVATAMLAPDIPLHFTGLAERDLRRHGGHLVESVSRLATEFDGNPLHLLHVGGELLTCNAWEAAVMLLPPEDAQPAIAYLEAHPEARRAWVHEALGMDAEAPYILSRKLFPHAQKVVYCGVGGVDFDECEPALRNEVIANLRAADAVGVRDGRTLSLLRAAGIEARLMPDPAVMVAELFGERIRGHAEGIVLDFPQGYLAVQFSADFGDDATLAEIAAQLDEAASRSGLGIVFFRAGAAPWHDDIECYRRVAARMRAPVRLFESLDIWDLCALIANARTYCGSSLHGRIVATAFAVPGINLLHPAYAGKVTKQAAYADTWDVAGMQATTGVGGIADGIRQALAYDREALRRIAGELAARYRAAFGKITEGIG